MGGLFGGGSAPAPYVPPPLPERTDPEVEARRRRQRLASANRRGRRASIITGGQGVAGEANLSTTAAQPGARTTLA